MSIGNGVDRGNCSNPIDASVLADYWLAALTGYRRSKPSKSICSTATGAVSG